MEPFKKPIKVTQPLLPDPYEFDQKIREIWDSRQLSNCGRMAAQLESALARFLHAEALSIYANGTLALQIACRLMDLTGEVITTPFTFPATVNALYWNNLTPVFCDIEEETYNLDPDLLEPLITEKTTAIMPVHVFGNPCDTEKIQRIADRHGLKVIYDAAHAFGVWSSGKPISSFGDITMFSFHATKVYHTIEGGALVFNDPCIKARADRMKNFGLMPDGGITEPGTNAKLNEVQAAVGLLLLDKIEEEIQKRKEVTADYTAMLSDVPGIRILKPRGGIVYNYPYFVITVDENAFGISRDALYDRLKRHNILARRYFYPLSSNLECYRDLPSSGKSRLPAANKAADSVLALPLYGDLSHEETAYICMVIRESGPPDGARTAEPLPRP